MGTAPLYGGSWRSLVTKSLDADAAQVLLEYRPQAIPTHVWESIQALTMHIAVRIRPATPDNLRKQMYALAHFLQWAHAMGLAGSVEECLTAENVETWRVVAFAEAKSNSAALSTKSVADYVARLRRLGPKVNPDGGWPPARSDIDGGVKQGAREPYSDEELQLWFQAAHSAPHDRRKFMAEAFFALGLGVGLSPGEYRLVTASCVHTTPTGLEVHVPGAKARVVPVAAPWQPLLRLCCSRVEPDERVLQLTSGKNALQEASTALRLFAHRRTLSPDRLRTTWMVQRLRAGVDPRVLQTWAGLETLNRLPDLVSFLPAPDLEQAHASLLVPVGPVFTR